MNASLEVTLPDPVNNAVEWTIRDVAAATGLTSRALRHYEQIGLLAPPRIAPSGYRFYGDRELAELYRILSLRAHLALLHEHQQRTATQISSVQRAVSTREKGTRMTIKDLFAGVDNSEDEDEDRQRWGNEAWERSDKRRTSMTDEQRAEDDYRTADVNASLRAAAEDGIDPFAPHFPALVTEHYAWVAEQWAGLQPARDTCIGLSQMYVADERFASYYGGQRNAEAIYAAIQHWANLHL